MKLEFEGILVSMRPINERDVLASVFSREYGMLSGVIRGAVVARKNRALVGQTGSASWNARLDSQLGVFHWEPKRNIAAPLMMNMQKLGFMNAAFALIGALLPERERYEHLYDATIDMLDNLINNDSKTVYLNWEEGLLRDLGFALDLSHCSGCGGTNNLNYLSPRTGRAVCDDCAGPYINKLDKLPISLDITLRFIMRICSQMGIDTPVARMYLSRMQEN